ncbi:MAG TPA: alpha-L-rhamnosidase C-terminal domain-containing protein [Chitinophagaceae bacterium]|nr:alpha-L-rhamnosidase C-terminal domain-containing protein [Chitinophagaceae bacterium]
MKSHFLFLPIALLVAGALAGQSLPEELNQQPWKAQWITGPGPVNNWSPYEDPALKEYGVYKFRKSFTLAQAPAHFVVHVSGDNRYKLYVNGQLASLGPARGDLYFWNFETVDIAPYLHTGSNTLAALVWNDGRLKPEAQISFLSAFILQGDRPDQYLVNTDTSWKCLRDSSYTPLRPHVPGYYVAGPGELIRMKDHASGWNLPDFDDQAWGRPRPVASGLTKDAARDSRGWMLVPSPLPQMEWRVQRLASLRKASGVSVDPAFPASRTQVLVPAHTRAELLLDQGYLTNAYPTLLFSGGKDAGLSLTYAEALYEGRLDSASGQWVATGRKGQRNEVDGKVFIGKQDSLVADGRPHQEFTSLWYRTYRYIRLRVQTREEPLVIEDLFGTFAGYPFQLRSKFELSDSLPAKILEIGWRTARLCAMETYMDCPYYEQLQYIGDARIQALVTLFNTSDDRLVRNALTLMDHSRIAEGITLSRYPTDLQQQIPTFSLWWIGMLHDYWMYRPDAAFIRDKLPGERQVLNFFQHYQGPDGSLQELPYWIFTDWVDHPGWEDGQAPVSRAGYSSVLDIQLMWTYQLAAELESRLGFRDYANLYRQKALQLKATIQRRYWDAKRGLYADTEDKTLFSQHANALAILGGLVQGEAARRLGEKLLTDTSLAQASIYFKYYLHRALVRAGLGDHYLDWLGKWQEDIRMGLTTWAEMSDVSGSRSDCHAWGSSPNIEFYRTVLGIDSDAPGFRRVRIEPHLGKLSQVAGSIPHPEGSISVSYRYQNSAWQVEIGLPPHTAGTFWWKGKPYPLRAGSNRLQVP